MMKRAIAIVVALITTVAIAVLSELPYEADTEDHAMVRLAWRVRGDRLEQCRTLTAEEVAALPAHMRRETECEGQVLPYQLVATIDGDTVVYELVRAAGARQDRPLYVSHSFPVAPGRYAVSVGFERQGKLPDSGSELTPGRLEFTGRLELSAKEIALITYDADQRRLVLRGYGQ